ncbi:MAG: hypothetical protein O7G83_21395 [Proteobacteria bacterium]|nr:hypothetical protein [Pseudomonadota bacterium]MCZ6892771.1 hypothetical protein [Gammaproteobacteria bacterium]
MDDSPLILDLDQDADADLWVRLFVTELIDRHGDAVSAILLYGSHVRGKRDTVLDFYVLLNDYTQGITGVFHQIANRILPPNVYHLTLEKGDRSCAAKFATVTLAQFEHGISRRFHSYFWARFAQPFVLAYARDASVKQRLRDAGRAAARRMMESVIPVLPPEFSTEALWQRAFALTYDCELRAEGNGKAAELFAAYAVPLAAVTDALAPELALSRSGEQRWRSELSGARRHAATWSWRVRRVEGKLLSVARLFKAAFTFNDPLDYILWKVERHSGIHMEPTALQRRHPLIFSWGLLWRLYRLGGFK